MKMLPRRSHSLSTLLVTLSLVSLWSLQARAISTTLTVNLTNAAIGSHGTVTAPEVCNVTFIYRESFSIMNDEICLTETETSCSLMRMDSNMTVVFKDEDGNEIRFTVNFDSGLDVSCSDYIPDTLADSNLEKALFTCIPVFSCNASDTASLDLLAVEWWRFTNENDTNDFIDAVDKSSFSHNRVDSPETSIANITGDFGENLQLKTTSGDYRVIGYYVPTFRFNTSLELIENGQRFIVYIHPVLDKYSKDREVIFGTDKARDYEAIYCRFTSFPPATVTWSRDGFDSTKNTGVPLTNTSVSEPTLTLRARLLFDKVDYTDGGDYRCTADNGISTERPSEKLRFRVRNPLRPLWPAIGIVCSFIITALFIFGGAVVDKLRAKLTSKKDDDSFHRNYSVVSNLGEESGNSGEASHSLRQHQSAGKRISITQQELLPNAS